MWLKSIFVGAEREENLIWNDPDKSKFTMNVHTTTSPLCKKWKLKKKTIKEKKDQENKESLYVQVQLYGLLHNSVTSGHVRNVFTLLLRGPDFGFTDRRTLGCFVCLHWRASSRFRLSAHCRLADINSVRSNVGNFSSAIKIRIGPILFLAFLHKDSSKDLFLRGAWRDCDPKDVFAHCSLIFLLSWLQMFRLCLSFWTSPFDLVLF